MSATRGKVHCYDCFRWFDSPAALRRHQELEHAMRPDVPALDHVLPISGVDYRPHAFISDGAANDVHTGGGGEFGGGGASGGWDSSDAGSSSD